MSERQGLMANLMDSWTPERVQESLDDWNDDEWLRQTLDEGYEPQQEQHGLGEKRSSDEVDDDASTSEQVSENDYFIIEGTKQVNIKKFKTTGTDYTVRFTNTIAHFELSEYHRLLHQIFGSLLQAVTRGIPEHSQVRFVMRLPRLENLISLPFMPLPHLTTERVLSHVERVLQYNKHFRFNDTVTVNLVHVNMPNGGTGSKRSEINLEKHLTKKGSVIRIRNKEDLCLARAPASIAKIENGKLKSVVDSRRPLQTQLAYDLHEKAYVSLGPCGLEEVKQFQVYLSDYQINIVSKEHQDAIIYSGPDKEKRIYLYLHDNHYDVIAIMPAFLVRK